MPDIAKLIAHDDKCPDCRDLLSDLSQVNSAAIDGATIRRLHQGLHHLSPTGWNWVLPHYLRYCVTPEAAHNRFETEYLIYAFSPSPEYEKDTYERMVEITNFQAQCLYDFFDWCLDDAEWRSIYYPDITAAQRYLAKRWTLDKTS